MSLKFLKILPFLIIFVVSLFNSADLDLGWHLKYGQYFVQNHQVLRENTFSSQMPTYRYSNSSWASDVLLYLVFSKFGFLGPTALGAVIITLTFYFFKKAANLTLWDMSLIFPIVFYLELPVNSASYRAEQLSLMFLGLLLYLIIKYTPKRPKKLFLVLPLFLVWVNAHGEFLTGLTIFFIWIFTYITIKLIFETKNRSQLAGEINLLTFLAVLSILVTFINPFGFGMHYEALKHFANPLEQYVIQWQPLEPQTALWWNQIAIVTLTIASFFLIIKKGQFKANFPILLIVALIIFMPFWSRRYAWVFYYLAIFPLSALTRSIRPKKKPVLIWLCSAFTITFIIYALATRNPFSQFKNMSWENYCLYYVGCSPKAAQFLVDNNLGNNLYTFYDWGGYLIWNYPQIKPGLDGRMAFWTDANGYNAFSDYYSLQQNWQDINKSSYNVALINLKKPIYFHLLNLVKSGQWELGYQDAAAAVFIRKK